MTEWWAKRPGHIRFVHGFAAIVAIGAFGLTLRASLPEVFARFSREEGVWEPVSLLSYAGAATLLFRSAREFPASEARHLQLLGGCFVFLTLEEIDYFGIFGGMIGRIDGVYVGTLHDLIVLAEEGLLPGGVVTLLGVLGVGAAWMLLRRGYLQPARLAQLAGTVSALWLATGAVWLVVASAEEAGFLGWQFSPPSPEELFEVMGALALGGFALQARADTCAAIPTAADEGATDSEVSEASSAA